MEEFDFEEIARARWAVINPPPEAVIERFKGKSKKVGMAIMDLSPGRELNFLVAKYVMDHDVVSDATLGELEGIKDVDEGTIWALVQPYSEDLDTAYKVVERMVAEGHIDALSWYSYGEGIYTPAEAICKRAFIRKVLGMKG